MEAGLEPWGYKYIYVHVNIVTSYYIHLQHGNMANVFNISIFVWANFNLNKYNCIIVNNSKIKMLIKKQFGLLNT